MLPLTRGVDADHLLALGVAQADAVRLERLLLDDLGESRHDSLCLVLLEARSAGYPLSQSVPVDVTVDDHLGGETV